LRFSIRSLDFPGWIYIFRAPRSATGEDVVELHVPGNPLLARMMLEVLVRAGSRHADPGEFTARGYFNGKLDLAQAEGIAATIAAQSEGELRAARQLLGGELARRLAPVLESIACTLALVEAGIDFSDEDISFVQAEQVCARIDAAVRALDELVAQSARFERLSHEPQVVLVGRPNAGKSTLLNALSGRERAVVSEAAGTTRDALSVHVALARGLVRVIDVAGIVDESDVAAYGAINSQMRRQALRALESADFVLLVRDCTDERPPIALARAPDITVRSKVDLSTPSPWYCGERAGERGRDSKSQECCTFVEGKQQTNLPEYGERELVVSALNGTGMSELFHRLDVLAFGAVGAHQSLALNARHLQLIADARASLDRARDTIDSGQEILALELRESLDAVGGILGQLTPDDVLGRIFSRFCIGK
jgi:tRNA modification GTPase